MQGKKLNTLSIIIVTRNAALYIEKCLESFSNHPGYRIIIVDNNSDDTTVSIIKRLKRQNITLIRNNYNAGFAKACNTGAKRAKEKYLLFLNPDTRLQISTIQKTIRFAEKNGDVIVGCKTLNMDNTLQPSCGRFPTISNVVMDRIPFINKVIPTHLIRIESFYNQVQQTDWVSGAFLLIRRETFHLLSGFDERFFLYMEDVDLCFRAKEEKIPTFFYPKASIIHLDMGKSKERKSFKARQIRNGLGIFFDLHYGSVYSKLWKLILLLESVINPSIKFR